MKHSQRKGQWLFNHLSLKIKNTKDFSYEDVNRFKAIIADRLWNMNNTRFNRLMREYKK